MDATVPNPLNAPVFEIPDPTEDFGQDGGKFYRCYDALADEIDEDLVTGLKEQLDGMLIFAGLFAGVNTAFLAFTLPLLSADPADDTNTLLAQNNAILIQLVTGRNDSIPTNSALPSAEFTPATNIFAINALFSLSLAFAIISSFLAVLGRQWLVYYRKRSGGGPDRQRWDQLKRYLGAERWQLKPILDDVLPSLLQIGLIIFCVSLLLYLHHLSPAISVIVGIPLYIGLAFFVGSALCTVWDKFCPFYSPLSHMLFWSARKIPSALDTVKGLTWDHINSFSLRPWLYVLVHGRTEESPESLQVIALQRTICTSDDPATLLSATANIFGITTLTQMKHLWSDDAFQERFTIQLRNSYSQTLQLRGQDQIKFAEGVQRLYCAAEAHIVLFLEIQFSEFPNTFLWAMRDLREASVVIPGPRIPESPNSLIRSTLAFAILQLYSYFPPLEIPLNSFQDYIMTCYNGQKPPTDWRLLCVLSFIVSNLPRLGQINFSSLDSLRKAYRGDTEHATVILMKAFDVLVGPNYSDDPDLGKILIDMLRSVQQVIMDDNAPWEHRFAAAGSCERALRGPRLPEALKQTIRKLRLDFSQGWERECEVGAANWDIPTSLFEGLYHYLQHVRTISQSDVTCDESIIVLHAFGPPTIKLFAHDTMAWKDPWEINKKRGDLRKVFDEFVSEVDGISRRIQANAKHVRDPDGRWCHWQEELVSIKALYSLPSVLSEVPTIPAGHNGIVDDNPALSLDMTKEAFNYMFNIASSRS